MPSNREPSSRTRPVACCCFGMKGEDSDDEVTTTELTDLKAIGKEPERGDPRGIQDHDKQTAHNITLLMAVIRIQVCGGQSIRLMK